MKRLALGMDFMSKSYQVIEKQRRQPALNPDRLIPWADRFCLEGSLRELRCPSWETQEQHTVPASR